MNHFEFLGRLTKDVEVKSTTTGTVVANFSLAVNRKFKKEGEERQTDFFNLTAFGKTGEFVQKHFRKGGQVLVCGRMQNRSWEDTTGAKRYATDYIVEDTYFADSKKQDGSINDISELPPVPSDGEYITIDNTADLPF